MKTMWRQALAVWLVAGAGSAAHADVFATQVNGVDLRASGAISAQGGAFQAVETGDDDTAGEIDASILLNAEYVSDSGLVWGARAEFDTGNRAVEDLQRDELYVYLAGGFGRIELGEQDGPADTISIHAPIVGLGQIRGDFVRYTGAPALLSPFDTRDDLKIIYLSPPIGGFRWGVSYAPSVESNADNPVPRRRTQQDNAWEAAAAYQIVAGSWAVGASASYVVAEADPITERGDIESWSVGVEATRDQLTFGGAYVSRGDSNSLVVGLDETEWNAGVTWRADGWGVAGSASLTESSVLDNRLIGVGGYYEFNEWWVARADAVAIQEETAAGVSRDGYVGMVEISFQF